VSTEALAFLLIVAASSSAQVTTRHPLKLPIPPFTANKGELLQKLRDRRFQELDAQLDSYQTRFEQDALAEGNLATAFEAFSSPERYCSAINMCTRSPREMR
jgi:hypothetical protein